ncbi:hypothetical protein BDQ17DRAFT_1323695 [Cyathus striatus]|nr:hypothetical protein BDQ17DRAFT_1323695 [Cyathus striatus]
MDIPMELHTAAGVGKVKLLKYKLKAVTNHNYILGTALHPFMHMEWFCKVVPTHWDTTKDARNKDEKVLQVQVLIHAVAEKYQLEMEDELQQSRPLSSQVPAPTNLSTLLSVSSSLASIIAIVLEL